MSQTKHVKLGQESKPGEDSLKACVIDLLNQGGRSEEEATAWCKDYLAMGGETNEPTSIDGANIREAERIMIQTRLDIMKPEEMEQCIRNRQALFGEGESTASRRCREDWEMGERVRGSPAVATDTKSRLSLLDPPEAFRKLERLRIALDHRTSELINEHHVGNDSRRKYYHYTPEEADRKARKELGLPQVYHKKPEPEVTVPDVTGKSREQRIKESIAADAKRRPGTVPDVYGKSHVQIVEEAFAQDAEDKNR